MRQATTTLGEIAAMLLEDLRPDQDGAHRIDRVSGASDATPASLVFATDVATLAAAVASGAGAILAAAELARDAPADPRILYVKEPRTAFARVYARWFDRRGAGGVHATAIVAAGAVLGVDVEIGAGACVADDVRIGDGCILGPHVTVLPGTTLGKRVKVQAGAVLGSDGFGFARTREGYIGFPQIGRLLIGDDVEIGANTTIDRGALGETRIGRGTKIDNLVHIAHNCVIGEDCILAAQVGLAGSITVEDNAMLGGQAGLGEGVTIGRGVILGGQGGVLPGKKLEGEGVVYWGTPAQPVREYLRALAKTRRL